MDVSIRRHGGYTIGIALIFAATVCWSTAGLFVRAMPPMTGWQINGGRALFAAFFMMIWLVLLHGRRLPVLYRTIPKPALLGFAAQFTIGSTMYALALTLAPVANVACIGAISPVLTAVIASLTLGERTTAATWIAAAFALSGMVFIVGDGLDTTYWPGNLLALGAVSCWSVQAVILRGYAQYDLMPGIVIAGLATFLVAAIVNQGFEIPSNAMLPLALMGLLQLTVPIILFARGARYVSAVTASLVLLLDAVFNPLWAFLGVGEVPSLSTAIGGAIIVVGVTINILAGSRTGAS